MRPTFSPKTLGCAQTEEWPALIRSWISQQDGQFLELALETLRHEALRREVPYKEVVELLEELRDRGQHSMFNAPLQSLAELSSQESNALSIVALYADAALCEAAAEAPSIKRNSLLQIGLNRAAQGISLASEVGDNLLVTFFLCLQARAWFERGELDRAADAFRTSRKTYEQLAGSGALFSRRPVATTLNNLGATYLKLNQPNEARECLVEALEILRNNPPRIAVSNPEIALVLENLGDANWALQDVGSAEKCYLEAAALRRKAPEGAFEGVQARYARVLQKLGRAQKARGEVVSALATLKEVVEVYRKGDQGCSDECGSLLASSLFNLGEAEWEIGDEEAALSSLAEAYRISQQFADQRTRSYVALRSALKSRMLSVQRDLLDELDAYRKLMALEPDYEANYTAGLERLRKVHALYTQVRDTEVCSVLNNPLRTDTQDKWSAPALLETMTSEERVWESLVGLLVFLRSQDGDLQSGARLAEQWLFEACWEMEIAQTPHAVECFSEAARAMRVLASSPTLQERPSALAVATLGAGWLSYQAHDYAGAVEWLKSASLQGNSNVVTQGLGALTANAVSGHQLFAIRESMLLEARSQYSRNLKQSLSSILERFKATSAWLFLREGDALVPRIRQNGDSPGRTIKLNEERSIVAHVARTEKGDCVDDVQKDARYLELVPGTRSELAAPIRGYDDSFLGVINLESCNVGNFTPSQVMELGSAACLLAPSIRLLQSLEKYGEFHCTWNYYRSGWGLSHILGDICFHLTETAGEPGGNLACTIWELDRQKGHLYVRATAGFDSEYTVSRTLPYQSFAGEITQLSRGSVKRCDWSEAKKTFLRKDKAEQMGLCHIIAAPIFRPRANTLFGAMSIYCFGARAQLPDSIVRHLADLLGGMVESHEELQPLVAAEFCSRRLRERCFTSRELFEVLKQTLLQCLSAEYCSVFARKPRGRKLICVASTGLECNGKIVHDLSRATYDLKTDRPGMTLTAARHPGVAIRKNDVPNPEEKSGELSVNPNNKFRERFAMSDTDHRRFIGIGVASDGDLLGVIRLNRASTAKPFLPCDEELIARLASVSAYAFERWRSEQAARVEPPPIPHHVQRLSRTQGNDILHAFKSLVCPSPGVVSHSRLALEEILQDILVAFKQHGGILASLRELTRSGDEEALEIRAFHSTRFKEPWTVQALNKGSLCDYPFPLERRKLHRLERGSESVAWLAIDHGTIIHFERPGCGDLFKPIHQDSDFVAAGACIPFTTVNQERPTKWVFCLDCTKRVRWSADELYWLAYAAQRLEMIVGGSILSLYHSASEFLDTFIPEVQRVLGTSDLDLRLAYPGNIMRPVTRSGGAGLLKGDWRNVPGCLSEVGLEYCPKIGGAYRLNLKCGPADAGVLTWKGGLCELAKVDQLAAPVSWILSTWMNFPYLRRMPPRTAFTRFKTDWCREGVDPWRSKMVCHDRSLLKHGSC